MPKLVSAPFSVFKRVLRSRNQDVVFVLHKPGCSDCREFIQNPYQSMQKITSYGANGKPDHVGREVKMVKIMVNREKDMADLELCVRQSAIVLVLLGSTRYFRSASCLRELRSGGSRPLAM